MTIVFVREGADPYRACSKCGLECVKSNGGKATCTDCQTNRSPYPCAGCNGPRRQQYPLCSDCRWLSGQCRPHKIKVCPSCGVEHASKGGNKECMPCQFAGRKTPCIDCGVMTTKKALRCRQCQGPVMQSKGGRYKNKLHGYVHIKAHDHPACTTQGYVREHILVMEAVLGRYLLPGETVHHMNGVRDDNRPENLELWAVWQPSGQRVADLVSWAEQVLARYAPDMAVLPLPTIPTVERVANGETL